MSYDWTSISISICHKACDASVAIMFVLTNNSLDTNAGMIYSLSDKQRMVIRWLNHVVMYALEKNAVFE